MRITVRLESANVSKCLSSCSDAVASRPIRMKVHALKIDVLRFAAIHKINVIFIS